MTIRSQLAKDYNRRIHQCYGTKMEISVLNFRRERETENERQKERERMREKKAR